MKTAQVILSALATAGLVMNQVAAHGHMTKPKGRTSDAFGDPNDKYACDSDKPGTVTSYKSGEEIEVVWTRNNHIGGFIRYSIVPKNAVSKAGFDANTFYYTCREANCSLKQCKDKYCGDDDGAGDDGITCRSKIKLPDYLEQGDYVLQWTWHAAGSSYGHIGWSTSNFKTCADIRLTTSGTGKKPTCPTFVGGDRVTSMEKNMDDAKKTSQCFYYDDNGLGKDYVKYSDEEGYKRYKFGIPKEIEKCGGASTPSTGNSTTSSPTTSPATGTASPVPSSSKHPKPKPGTDKPASNRPSKPPTSKPTTAPPTPSTEAPAPSSDGEDGDGNDDDNDSDGQGENGKDSDGDDNGNESDADNDAPGTVEPWKQITPKGGRKQYQDWEKGSRQRNN